MGKRLTDASKWRNAWFRTLPLRAKCAWMYLCDECDYAGIWKADFGLASFQLGFDVTKESMSSWFGDKIIFVKDDMILITQFFEFQYSEAKDTWSAKVKAKTRIESFGLTIENNKVVPPPPHSPPTNPHGGGLVLIDIDIDIKNNESKKDKVDSSTRSAPYPEAFEAVWGVYPRRVDKVDAYEAFRKNVEPTEYHLAKLAAERYLAYVNANGIEPKYIKHPATFFNKKRWKSALEEDYGRCTVQKAKSRGIAEILAEDEAKCATGAHS